MKIAIAQMGPVYLNAEATLLKQRGLIEEASKNGASLIIFPECINPLYPVEPRSEREFSRFWRLLVKEAISMDGKIMQMLRELARFFNCNYPWIC